MKAAPAKSSGRLSFGCPLAVLTVVAHDGGVRLKYAGWILQDDVSDVNVTAVYKRASLTTSLNRVVAPRFSAGWFTHRANAASPGQPSLKAVGYMVASDQHQPDNSRAIATLATRGFFFRWVKPCHLLKRRRLPAWPRARSAGSTLAHRARRLGPDVL